MEKKIVYNEVINNQQILLPVCRLTPCSKFRMFREERTYCFDIITMKFSWVENEVHVFNSHGNCVLLVEVFLKNGTFVMLISCFILSVSRRKLNSLPIIGFSYRMNGEIRHTFSIFLS